MWKYLAEKWMGWEGEESHFWGFIPLELGLLETETSGGLQGWVKVSNEEESSVIYR